MEKHADFGRKTIVLCAEYMNCDISVHCQQLDYGHKENIITEQWAAEIQKLVK